MFDSLTQTERDALWRKLGSASHKYERFTDYLGTEVGQDVLDPAFQAVFMAWREVLALRGDLAGSLPTF